MKSIKKFKSSKWMYGTRTMKSAKKFRYSKWMNLLTTFTICFCMILSLIIFSTSSRDIHTLPDIKTSFMVFTGSIFTIIVVIPVFIFNLIMKANIFGLLLFLWLIDKCVKER